MTSDAILADLRSLPGAPDRLRERVRSLPEPQPRFAWTLPRIDVRRALLVAAPVVVALGLGAAALNGVLTGGQRTSAQQLTYSRGGEATATTPLAVERDARAAKSAPFRALALPPSTTRLNKYNAWLRVRVDEDRLAKVTTRAMQIARGYGGYVSSVDMNTPGQHGTASLVLRVPVTKVEDAVLRLGQLGEVTAQRVRVQDLQRQANVLQREIVKLQATIAALERKQANGSLTPEERYRLDEAKRSLAAKTKARATTVREGTLATVSMTFFTPQAAAVVPHEPSRLGRTLSNAGDFLLLELSWLLYALIVVGPIALLAAAAVLTARAARRRSDARLLEGA
jgi:Domain of unknown function (DUF4349)